MSEIQFAEGMKAYKPREKAPEFVKADIVIDVAKFTVFINDHAKPDGSVRIQIKEGKTGNFYAVLDQWTVDAPKKEITREDSPFSPHNSAGAGGCSLNI